MSFLNNISVAAILLFVFLAGCVKPPENNADLVFLAAPDLGSASVGEYYSHTFCVPDSSRSGATCGALAGQTSDPSGGRPPYSFSHKFGTGFIPPGLALELNGLLRGTPSLPGTYTFGICAKDMNNNEACKNFTIIVNPAKKNDSYFNNTVNDTNPNNNTPNNVTPPISGTITINSLTCSIGLDKYGWGSFLTIASGTADGEVGAKLDLPYWWPEDVVDCGAWTHTNLNHCVRSAGNPGNTTWSIKASSDYIYVSTLISSRNSIDVHAIIHNPEGDSDTDEKETICEINS